MGQMQTELEYEFNAQYDYMSEAYGATARDANLMAEADAAEAAALIGPVKPFVTEIPF
jgi:hypothetical protein